MHTNLTQMLQYEIYAILINLNNPQLLIYYGQISDERPYKLLFIHTITDWILAIR